jgi:hypothetical protein
MPGKTHTITPKIPRGRRSKKHSTLEDTIGIPYPTMRKFAYTAGIQCITLAGADKVRELMKDRFTYIIEQALEKMKEDDRTTLVLTDFE